MINKQLIYQEIFSNFRNIYNKYSLMVDEYFSELFELESVGVFYPEHKSMTELILDLYSSSVDYIYELNDDCCELYARKFKLSVDSEPQDDELIELMSYFIPLTKDYIDKNITLTNYRAKVKNSFYNFGLKHINHHNSIANNHCDCIYDDKESGEPVKTASRNSLRHFKGVKSNSKIKQLFPPTYFGSHEIIMPNFDTL